MGLISNAYSIYDTRYWIHHHTISILAHILSKYKASKKTCWKTNIAELPNTQPLTDILTNTWCAQQTKIFQQNLTNIARNQIESKQTEGDLSGTSVVFRRRRPEWEVEPAGDSEVSTRGSRSSSTRNKERQRAETSSISTHLRCWV